MRRAEKPRPPVPRPAEIGHDHYHGSPADEPSDFSRARCPARSARWARDPARARSRGARPGDHGSPAGGRRPGLRSPNVATASRLPRRTAKWPRASETPSATVPLTPLCRSEGHRRRCVEQHPGLHSALCDIDPDVRLTGAGGDVPVDHANVVSGHVGAHLGKLGTIAEGPRPVIAGQKPVDPVRTTRFTLRSRAAGSGPGPGRLGVRSRPAVYGRAHATCSRVSSSWGIATRSSTWSRM